MLCSLPGEPGGASSTTSPRSRCAIHTVDQGGQRYVPDQRGQLSACQRLSLQVLSCREDALNNQLYNRQQVCTVVQHVWPTTEIVSDNGSQYVGQPYEDMCSKWNIKHTTTSPRYPQSNGLIERQVRTVKGLSRNVRRSEMTC